ncbi:MAG: LysR substrate-binding domain-containing protein, partial [Desulfobulbaceae bacterium]|nr:LysR substrate-binding domain-containing protein [Desulfobulbaceae bacterium]
ATLRICGSRLIADEVKSGGLDLGVVGAQWNESELSWTEIYTDHLSVVVNAQHSWAGKKNISPAMLLKEPFILRETASGTRKAIEHIIQSCGYKVAQLKEVAEMGSTSAVKEAVKAGLGVSILSDMAVEEEVSCGLLVRIKIKELVMTRPFYLIRRKNRELSPVATVFLNYFKKWVAEKHNR